MIKKGALTGLLLFGIFSRVLIFGQLLVALSCLGSGLLY